MTGKQVYPVSPEVAKQALLNREQYEEMYRQSVEDPDTFWGEHGKRLEWIKPYTKVKNTTYDYNNLSIKWFEDGQLNASANCLDRHLEKRGDQTAIIFEGDDPADSRNVTYRELHEETSKFANVLKGLGVKKGDVVTIYMPMIVETAVAMLACARIGVTHPGTIEKYQYTTGCGAGISLVCWPISHDPCLRCCSLLRSRPVSCWPPRTSPGVRQPGD